MGLLITIAVVALVGWFAWRGARQRYEEAQAALRRSVKRTQRKAAPKRPEAVTLEKDPRTGVYRPVDGD